jgi:DNA-binding protein HU-beta
MTKPDIVAHIAKNANLSKKKANEALEALVDKIHDSLSNGNGKIRISELGTFRVLEKQERAGVNPRTMKKMKIPSMRVPRFTPSKSLKELVKEA